MAFPRVESQADSKSSPILSRKADLDCACNSLSFTRPQNLYAQQVVVIIFPSNYMKKGFLSQKHKFWLCVYPCKLVNAVKETNYAQGYNPFLVHAVIMPSFDQVLTLTLHNSVKSWIQIPIDGKIRFSIKFCIRMHWLVLEKKTDFDRFYGHMKTI